jgi:glycosyltransferase involved in cell wall biosynthesis
VRVAFLIHSLQAGGAERQLAALARNLDATEFSATIVTFYAGGQLVADLQCGSQVRVLSAHKRGRWDVIGFLWRLWKIVRELRPDVIHGYMYGANELALILGRLVGARVVWGIRASELDMRHYGVTTRLLYRTGALLSSRADAVIANSEAGRNYHILLGYPPRRFVVIPNGIDTELFKRDPEGRDQVRSQWKISSGEILIGTVARIDPMKDHETFLRAAALLAAETPLVRFISVGTGPESALVSLRITAERLGIAGRMIWAGARQDMSAVYSAIDILTSTSAFGEGFWNCLAEAMACETICVATDVGDARIVIAETGEVVVPANAQALTDAWRRMLAFSSRERAERGQQARLRILDHFTVGVLADRTQAVLRSLGHAASPSQ